MVTFLNIIKCDFKEVLSLENAYNKLTDSLNGNENFWLENMVIEDHTISGSFFSKRNTYINQINQLTNKVERISTEIINSTYFVFDFASKVLEYYGNSKDYSRFIRNVSSKIDVYESLELRTLNMQKFYSSLEEKSFEIELLSMSIYEMQINPCLIGNYKAKVSSNCNATELLQNFKDKIYTFVVNYPLGDEVVKINVNKNCSYKFNCMEKNIIKVVNLIKSIQIKSYA